MAQGDHCDLDFRREAEFVASLMRWPSQVAAVAAKVWPHELTQLPARELYSEIVAMSRDGIEPTVANVADRLQQTGRLDGFFLNGSAGYLAIANFYEHSEHCGTATGYIEAIKMRCAALDRERIANQILLEVHRPTGSNLDLAELLDHWAGTLRCVGDGLAPIAAGDFLDKYPKLREPLIDGIIRVGETCNIIAPPKVGKSWLVLSLALSVATGRQWMGCECRQGNVLIVDNELHAETAAARLRKVADSLGLDRNEYANRLYVQTLRGELKDLSGMAPYFDAITSGRYALIILDAWYRLIPPGIDENSNGDMAGLYNQVDRHAARIGCSFACIHHASKGNQAGRGITDVGSGAGSQSRAVDAHVVLRQHESENVYVMEAAVRSFPPVLPRCVRWAWPLWSIDPEADPSRLAGAKPAKPTAEEKQRKVIERKAERDQAKAQADTLRAETLYQKLVAMKKATQTQLKNELGWSNTRTSIAIEQLLLRKQIKTCVIRRPTGHGGKADSKQTGYMPTTKSGLGGIGGTET